MPLLVKFLDISGRLSIQVHPDDASAKRFGETERAKTEAWFILDAEPQSFILLGCREGVTRSTLLTAIQKGNPETCLTAIKPRKGDLLPIPPGTLHCAGGGLTIFEVSTNCDLTYRLYDWRREEPDRKLSVEKALSCVFGEKGKPKKSRQPKAESRTTKQEFSLQELELNRSTCDVELPSFATVTVVSGSAKVHAANSLTELLLGESALLPASLSRVQISAASPATLLLCRG